MPAANGKSGDSHAANGHATNGHGSNGHPSIVTKEDPAGLHLMPGEPLSPASLAEYYNENVREAQENYDANDWAEPGQMYAQFEFLVEHVDLNGKTLLDVGSGNGLLFEFLAKRGITPKSITAIDLAEEGIRHIRENYPDVEAIAGDFFKYEFEQSYDVISMFGVAPCLKFMFPNKNRLSALLRLMDRAVRYANSAVVWSFLNKNCYETSEEENYDYVYYYPEEICSLLSGGRYDISTVHNDLVSNCVLYSEDAWGSPFRFNMNRLDDVLGILK